MKQNMNKGEKKGHILNGAPNSTVSKALSCNFCTWLRSSIFRIECVRVVFFTASLRENRQSFYKKKAEEWNVKSIWAHV